MGLNVEPYQMEYTDAVDSAAGETAEAAALSDRDRKAFEAVVNDIKENGQGTPCPPRIVPRPSGRRGRTAPPGVFGDVLASLNDQDGIYAFSSADAREWAAGEVTRMQAQLAPFIADGGKQDAYASALRLSSLLFWVLAFLVGTVQGGIQALSRSYFGKLVPPERSNEYFGFYDIFGKFASVIGPMLYSLFYMVTGRASIGIISLLVLFGVGGVLLLAGRKHLPDDRAPGKRRLNTDAMHVRRGGGPMMTPIVLFDLYDTLLRERSFDFGRGLDMLYETGFHTVCSREELAAYAAAFLPAYEARKTGHTEIAFIQKDYPAYCRRFGFRLPLPDEEVEYAVLSRMEEVEPEDGVEDALGFAGRGVRMYVLTNSIFLAPSQERLLREHGSALF